MKKKRSKSKVLKTRPFISLEEEERYNALQVGISLLFEAAEEARLPGAMYYLAQVQAELELRMKSRGCAVGVTAAQLSGILLQ